ncbi:MAG: phosphatidylserine/phosphatidylglycerophosphate/cardiolipin synthase family protein [Planctomycetes bacterium]|nr:phosphatidylserine/phosphatidylglycerophosphate/cardiolipin synthase family protein [Planctomycetota bacterium]
MRWFGLLCVAFLLPLAAQDELPRDWVLLGRKSNGQRYQGALRLTPQGNGFAWTRAELVDQVPEWTQGRGELRDGRLWLQPAHGQSVRHVLNGEPVASVPLHARYAGNNARLQGYVRYKQRLSYERLIPVRPGHENHVDLYVDGARFFAQLRSDMAQAQHSINVQSFIMTDDSTGRSLEAILVAKAQQGVKVRVMIDGAGNRMKGLEQRLRDGGVEVIVQHKLLKGAGNTLKDLGRGIGNAFKRLFGGGKPKPRERRGILNHDHRKITVIDGRSAFIGGMNLAHEYEHVWHDVHSRVVGPATGELQRLFFDRWHAAGGKGEPDPKCGLRPSDVLEGRAGQLKVEVVTSLPGVSRAIKERYLAEINGAQREVMIEVAYFLDDDIIDALQAAVARGVYVLVILPNDEDHDVKLVRDAFAFVQNDVVRSGVVLLKYPGRMVHSKVATFDGHTATVGSANLDGIALHHLAEANLFIPEVGFAGKLNREIFLTDIPKCERVQVKKVGFWQKLKSGALHVFRGFM